MLPWFATVSSRRSMVVSLSGATSLSDDEGAVGMVVVIMLEQVCHHTVSLLACIAEIMQLGRRLHLSEV